MGDAHLTHAHSPLVALSVAGIKIGIQKVLYQAMATVSAQDQ